MKVKGAIVIWCAQTSKSTAHTKWRLFDAKGLPGPFDMSLHWSHHLIPYLMSHRLELHLVEVDYEIGGNRAILVEQPLVVQAPRARQAEDRAFISVAEFGGSYCGSICHGGVLPLGTSVAR